ncbi:MULTISPECIES: glycoside hydrolase family 13 protein [Pectobacterium]|uniref:Alpha-glucosidase n=1 Tax=Pectobacterium odoriferum TaxID=78398 RepID=A0ABD6VKD8_9GAMM|nr:MULTISPECIES: alpha-glucosidase [Pectobacterium]AIU88810.1 oligo-1,6-glucosidase [Pectobacterium odoriferum]KGA38202.1 oligo-1,6-glucosidase [Pectobacterium odoriferum]MBA0187714.1 alpha-glucosidase [Pectobacterium odoriferum]MCA6960237.1 alpha-glucosidase [Pectobacterium odoriferum]MCH5008356.1 alpha-glucosidase [Pectobacterium odoriferum]
MTILTTRITLSAMLAAGLSFSAVNYAATAYNQQDTQAVVAVNDGVSVHPVWWKEAVFYQVYPRSFKDSDGDGIGDLKGLTEKLDYLKALGINAIWINPHYDSPNTDNGYDIRDYRKIMKEYGTMDDFDRLIAEMKKRDMRLMIDVVVNHTSDEHKWFVESKKSQDNPYRDYYIWRDGKDGTPPNNYPSFFGGSAWQKDNATQQYYLHYFGVQQPDLNWDNPKVREEVYDMLRFWIDKGVSGLRMDTVATFSKNPAFPDLTPKQLQNFAYTYTQGPNLHRYIQEMHQKVLAKYDVVSAGEIFGVPLEEAAPFIDQRRKELDMAFSFDLIRLDRAVEERWRRNDWTLSQFRQINKRLVDMAGQHGWNTFFLSNHDNPRAVSHFGDDRPEWRTRSAKALATLALTQRATPFIYQGDELGMTNYPFTSLSEFDDIEVKGFWQDFVETGKVKPDVFLENVKQTSRDNSRTPFQWSNTAQAGFTTGTPWFRINPNYKNINAEEQTQNPDSIFHFYRQLIALRHATPAFTYGTYQDLDPNNNEVLAYTRELNQQRYLVVVNFKEKPVHYTLPKTLSIKQPLLESGQKDEVKPNVTTLELQPWQSGIYQLN